MTSREQDFELFGWDPSPGYSILPHNVSTKSTTLDGGVKGVHPSVEQDTNAAGWPRPNNQSTFHPVLARGLITGMSEGDDAISLIPHI